MDGRDRAGEGATMDEDVTIDRAYLLKLLTEVRPDTTLEDFRHYCNLEDRTLADLLSEVLEEGEAAIYHDEFNDPVICLTPLGMQRARVKLSQSHPPIWLSVDGEDPPIIAVKQAGFVLFTDLAYDDEDGNAVDPADGHADPRQLEPVEVLANVEEFGEWLLLDRTLRDGRKHPLRHDFVFHGSSAPWPADQPRRATHETPSASTWQEFYSRCPFCRHLPPDEVCQVCHNVGAARPCSECGGKKFEFSDLCIWCLRSGVDHLLPAAEVAQARRKQVNPAKPKKKPRKCKGGRRKKGTQ